MDIWIPGDEETHQLNVFGASGRTTKGGKPKIYHGGQRGR